MMKADKKRDPHEIKDMEKKLYNIYRGSNDDNSEEDINSQS